MPGDGLFPPRGGAQEEAELRRGGGVGGRRSWMLGGGRQGRQGLPVQLGHALLQETSGYWLPLRTVSSLRTADNDHQGTPDSEKNDLRNK